MEAPDSTVGWAAALAAAVLCASFPAWAADPAPANGAAAGDAEAAVWTPKQTRFTFMGFTTHYSCDGLRNKMRRVLLDFGARRDLQIFEYGCTAADGRPDQFPGVSIKMSVLQPAGPGDATATPVRAHWKMVTLRLDKDPVWEAGDCELIEQIKARILPLFAARNVQYTSNCVPHQLSPGGTSLTADFLLPDQKAQPPTAAH